MGDIVPYQTPGESREKTSKLGMIMFLGSWAVMFVALFFSYGMVRARSVTWPPSPAPALPVLLSAGNTLVIVLSSVVLQASSWTLTHGKSHLTPHLLGGATVLGWLFLLLQFLAWRGLVHAGFLPTSGVYGSVFYLLTGFHALHVLVGAIALIGVTVRSFRGAYTAARHTGLSLWTMYWHFVGFVWVFTFVTVYLL